jgi:catechol 2,3-dioxygenase
MTEPTISSPASPAAAIAADTRMGVVRLTVSDLARTRAFYEQVLGLVVRDDTDGELLLGPDGGEALVGLRSDPSAARLHPRDTGLFHHALLLPTRADLARALVRIARSGWPLDGASDHLVSEALYLSDPDGNGIEIYRDRPRERWSHEGGQLKMATLPLDLDDIVDELGDRIDVGPAPAGTTTGHVHLRVAELERTETFYHGLLGFDVVVRSYPGALFVSAGGYHHHLGLNTWHSRGGSPAPGGAIGLRSYEIVVPGAAELERVLARLRSAGEPIDADSDGSALLRDPNGIAVRLLSA